MNEWQEISLGDLIEIKHGFAFKGEFFQTEPNNVILITPGNFKIGGGWNENKCKYYNGKIPEDYILKGGELVITMTDLSKEVDTLGYSAIIPRNEEKTYLHNQRIGLVEFINDKINNHYLYWLMRDKEYRWHIVSSASGSTVSHTSPSRIKEYNFLLPPLPEQKAIASVLSSLDDKIDLLHRQNKTLEAMAETLFHQWFVEEAQEDWEEGCLGDVVELVYGKGLKKEIRTGSGYPVIGSSGVVGFHSDFLVEAPGIVIGRKGTLGKVIYLWDNFFPIDTTYYIKSKVESAGLLYEYFLLKTLNFEEMNSDSAVPGLNRDIALSTEIKIASLEKLHKFNQLTLAFIDKMKDNTKQIYTLEKLRDTLLPKLMSGEVKVI
jgi:type I restriction enzyme S subunit